MLNISENSIEGLVDSERFASTQEVREKPTNRARFWVLGGIGLAIFIGMFLPWTQTVPGSGKVTALKPGQRPQALQSAIAGRIEEWYVKDGDYVEKGDTLLFISDVKGEYFDPSLLERTQNQVDAKTQSVNSYREKVDALEKRLAALQTTRRLKMEQARNYVAQARLKIQSDSIGLQAARTNFSIAEQQFGRQQTLYDQGLKSLTELESRRLKLQEAQAKLVASENKLLTSRNELINYQVGLTSTDNEYNEKIAKARAEKFETLSGQFEAEGAKSKLQNAYSNYAVRRGMYHITAPQSGYVTQTRKTGIGETIKEGEEILSISPASYDIAIEMYISPRDLPLIKKNTEVRIIFDGWPAMVFSGWPGISTGTFGGRVVAVDNFTSPNNKFRALVAPDPDGVPWPEALRIGAGAKGVALLSDVPVWYELWRQLSGFPPEYYEGPQKEQEKAKKPKVKLK